MAYETKPGTWSLFRNDKGDNEKAPDYKGKLVTPDGHEFEIAGWLRESQKGVKYMSGTVKEPFKKQDPTPIATPVTASVLPPTATRPASSPTPVQDDLPF